MAKVAASALVAPLHGDLPMAPWARPLAARRRVLSGEEVRTSPAPAGPPGSPPASSAAPCIRRMHATTLQAFGQEQSCSLSSRAHDNRPLAAAVLLAVAIAASGCLQPAPTSLPAPTLASITIAVAPAPNHSGSRGFDPLRVADLLASELQSVRGVKAIGVSRVLAAMHAQGIGPLQSPAQAVQVARALGADRIVVVAITKYDSYDPPVIGMTAQLYEAGPPPKPGVTTGGAPDEGQAHARQADTPQIRAQVQRVYNAAHQPIVKAVREFADLRNAEGSPFGWRKYLVSQQRYLRFCCYSTVRELMRQECWQSLEGVEPAA